MIAVKSIASPSGPVAKLFTHFRALPAPIYGLGSLALLFAIILALGWGAALGTDVSRAYVDGVGWLTWRTTAALAISAFLLLFGKGVRFLVYRREYELPASRKRVRTYSVVAALAIATTIGVSAFGTEPWRLQMPVSHIAWRTRAVLYIGLSSAVPWFVLTWLCHDRCRPQEQRPWNSADKLTFDQLERLWDVLVYCLRAFAIGVTSAMLTAGALRFAFLEAQPQCDPGYKGQTPCAEDFPAVDVLLFGAAFAIAGVAVALPLIVSWRGQAASWVEQQAGPPPEPPTEDWLADRDRLAAMLHLNTPILREPLALLSILTPLVTSLLAAFLPQLGG
jgi:hypothetical protein